MLSSRSVSPASWNTVAVHKPIAHSARQPGVSHVDLDHHGCSVMAVVLEYRAHPDSLDGAIAAARPGDPVAAVSNGSLDAVRDHGHAVLCGFSED